MKLEGIINDGRGEKEYIFGNVEVIIKSCFIKSCFGEVGGIVDIIIKIGEKRSIEIKDGFIVIGGGDKYVSITSHYGKREEEGIKPRVYTTTEIEIEVKKDGQQYNIKKIEFSAQGWEIEIIKKVYYV